MSRNTLVISWLNGQVRASSVRGTQTVSSWQCPQSVDTPQDFKPLVRAAVTETQFRGHDLVIVVENRNLLYHLQEAPLGRPSVLRTFMERRVAQSRFFEAEPAAWGISQPIPVKSGYRFLLTLLPRRWLEVLKEASEAENLRLIGVFAPAVILAHYLQKLPVPAGQPALLTSELNGTLCFAVGKKDHVWFARSVAMAALSTPGAASSEGSRSTAPSLKVVRPVKGTREADRLEQEINRTRLFSQQQFETNITQLWALGESARVALDGLRLPDGLSLEAVQLPSEADFLAVEAAQLTSRTGGNLLNQLTGQEVIVQRKRAVAVAALLALSIAFCWWMSAAAQQRQLDVVTLMSQAEEAQSNNDATIRLWKETLQRQALVSAVGTNEDPPIPDVFLRYIGSRLPEQFVLSKLDVNRSSNRWQFRLEGRQKDSPDGQLRDLEALERELTNSVLRAQITASTRLQIFQPDPNGDNGPRSVPTTATLAEGDKPFYLEGIIQ